MVTSQTFEISGQAQHHRRRDPTPAEIAAACLEIQATWNEQERLSRMVQKPREMTPIQVRSWHQEPSAA